MKKIGISIMALTLVVAMSCKKKENKETTVEKQTTTEVKKEVSKPEAKKIKVSMESKSDSNASGNVVFKEEDGVVTMTAVFDGLNPGVHAIHLHEKADCSSKDGKSANGHWNPTSDKHGKWGSQDGYHKGDIGNFTADENGNGTITFETDKWCIDCGDPKKDIIGKGIILHEGADDFTSQPSGAAGTRVSCGAITQ
ncbi:superoxide dismutase family protein [Joostella atrarenae]|uniref:Superoxide dismutase family protein n=1 Tax=Joostella atrarenae TaxID=679257 RepID=A0ABS9J2X4_9FLAO|nr:superoxide dismutase family protein [Joostella atrarenae]MCF8714772.1 superoxide dismutase family protein [Joostella atrarenae]